MDNNKETTNEKETLFDRGEKDLSAIVSILSRVILQVSKKTGRDAYKIAVEEYGFSGTEQEWMDSLKGEKGDKGDKGDPGQPGAKGDPGEQGPVGKSALEVMNDGLVAVGLEPLKTVDEFKTMITGPQGKSAMDLINDDLVKNGLEPLKTVKAFKDMLKGDKGDRGPQGPQGKSAYEVAKEFGYTGIEEDWLNSLKGDKGDQGPDGKSAMDLINDDLVKNGLEPLKTIKDFNQHITGPDGKSAYQLAKEAGFEGSEEDWLTSLKGKDGTNGTNGDRGPEGKSAYEVAKESGFEGSEEDWLTSLKGKDGKQGPEGKSAYQVAVESGFEGSEDDWLTSLKGKDGKSAYQVALDAGYNGTKEDWLTSLKGKDGTNGTDGDRGPEGKSAYEVAKETTGFSGTKEDWIESLKGSDGKSAYQIAQKSGFKGTEKEWLDSLKVAQDETAIQNRLSTFETKIEDEVDATLSEFSDLNSTNSLIADPEFDESIENKLNEFVENLDDSKFKILLVSDQHYSNVYDILEQDPYGDGFRRILKMTNKLSMVNGHVDVAVFNGDNMDGGSGQNGLYEGEWDAIELTPNEQVDLNLTRTITNTDRDMLFKADVFLNVGNHDFGLWSQRADGYLIDYKQVLRAYNFKGNSFGETRQGFNAYKDYQSAKVRVMTVDLYDYPEIYTDENTADGFSGWRRGNVKYAKIGHGVVTQATLDFVKDALASTPEGYTVLIFSHMPYKGYGFGKTEVNYHTDNLPIRINHELLNGLLQAYNGKRSFSGTGDNADYPASISADFSNAVGVIGGCFFGHEHRDVNPENVGGVYGTVRQAFEPYERKSYGTINQYSFDVLEVDTANKHVDVKRFGNGSDVSYDY